EEKILLKEKLELEDVKTLSVGEGMKVNHFLLNKKRNIDNFDGSSTKKKVDSRIRVTEMTLNESKMEVLLGDNLEEVKKNVALIYAVCGYLDYRVEDTKEIISLFNKKEKFFKNKTDRNSGYNNMKLDLQTRLTLWDLLASSKFAKIRHCFSHFGKITAPEWKDFDKTRAVFVSILCKNKKTKKNLESLWSLHYKEGNLCRLISDKFDAELLKKRKEHRAVLRGISHTALKEALL
ncbi:3746_t:CDS:2, partial [Gigaspora margarita]